MRNKAIYILKYLFISLVIYLGSLYYIQNINLYSLWVSFSIGAVLIIIAILLSIKNIKNRPSLPIIFNSLSIAFLVNAYMMKADIVISLNHCIYIVLGCFIVYLVFILTLYIKLLERISGWYLLVVSLVLLGFGIYFWITSDKALFSNSVFSGLLTISFLFSAISFEDKHENINQGIVISSFVSLIVLMVVLCLLLESGDFLEGFTGFGNNNRVRRAPQHVRF